MSELMELARRQLGLFTRAQALQLVSVDRLRGLLERGLVLRSRRGVYVVAGAPPTYEQAVFAALLAAGDHAWASHRTAARLWGLRVPPPEAVDVLTLPIKRLRLEGVAHHRNERLPMRDLTAVGGVPVTSVARTLVDCIPWLSPRALVAAVDDARRRQLLDVGDLDAAQAAVDKGRRTGRHKVVPMRPVLADRVAGQEAGGSDREIAVLHVLRSAGLPTPVQQFPVLVGGRWRYLDFAYPDEHVYLEFEGFAEHGLIRSTFDDDRERDAELALLGWLKLGITSNTRDRDLASRVARALAARAS